MKKPVLLFLLFLSSLTYSNAQNPPLRKNRIYTGGSLIHSDNIQIRNLGHSAVSLSGLLGYERRFNEKWSLGLDYYLTATAILLKDSHGNEISAGAGMSTLQLKTRYRWHRKYLDRYRYSFYSGLGIGTRRFVVIATDGTEVLEESGFGIGGQLDVIGGEIAWNWFGLWAEAGVGTQGNLKVGMSFNF